MKTQRSNQRSMKKSGRPLKPVRLGNKEKIMKDTQFEKMSIKDLRELREKVDRAITSRQVDERNGLKEKFREMAEEAGFNLSEILVGRTSKGKPDAAKFANPLNSQETWSGRGRQPNWLSSKLKSGANIEDFRLG